MTYTQYVKSFIHANTLEGLVAQSLCAFVRQESTFKLCKLLCLLLLNYLLLNLEIRGRALHLSYAQKVWNTGKTIFQPCDK